MSKTSVEGKTLEPTEPAIEPGESREVLGETFQPPIDTSERPAQKDDIAKGSQNEKIETSDYFNDTGRNPETVQTSPNPKKVSITTVADENVF